MINSNYNLPKHLFLLLFISISSCSLLNIRSKKTSSKNIVATSKKQDSLSFELCQIYGLDQGIRNSEGFENKMLLIQSIDSFNYYKVVEFIKHNGYPTQELLGLKNFKNECVEAAIPVVLLHNPHMIVNSDEQLSFFLKLVKMKQISESLLLTILDKYYLYKYGKVMYGSQFGMPCRKDSIICNSERKKLGFSDLPDSLFIDCK